MQTIPVSNEYQQKSSPLCNPLKNLFSYSLSPKQKTIDISKPKLSASSIQLGNKYYYQPQDLIGDGYTSKVYKGYEIQRPTKHYAIKVIEKRRLDKDQMKLIRNEIELHPLLDHKNIVKCYDVYDTPQMIYVVMEWCQSGDLAQYISGFRDKDIPEWRAIDLMEQIVNGCRYLVEQGILHRDLKPANVLRAGSTLKIADFGFAVKGKKTLIDTMSVGTPLYMPPQSLEECVYSHKSDFFALGCILYELLHGRTPWYKADQKALAASMKKSQIDLSTIKNQNIKQFISKACQISQGHRMSVDEFLSFDFRKPTLSLQLNMSGSTNFGNMKEKKLFRQNTERMNISSRSQLVTTTKSIKNSKKAETVMEATFASNHIYFKGAKCEEIKKITAEFQEKFQFCLLLKYLIENSNNTLLIEQFDLKNLKIVLFRHCIFVFKRLLNDFQRTKSSDLNVWLEYKETQQFKQFEQECKTTKQKMQKEFNLQLKGMSLKNLGEVNKRFPQLGTQYELNKGFYQKLKQFLKQIICKFHSEIIKRFQKSSLSSFSPRLSSNLQLSQYYQAFKSLYRYYENCEQKQAEQEMNRSFAQNMKMSKTLTSNNTTTAGSSDSSKLLSSAREQYPLKLNEANFGKKLSEYGHFNHVSPEYEKTFMMSPKAKHLINKTTEKKLSLHQDSIKVSQFTEQQRHHYYTLKPIVSSFEPQFSARLQYMMDVQSPKRKLVMDRAENKASVRPQTVESCFSQVLCRDYEESRMTKEEFVAMKKKIKWLW